MNIRLLPAAGRNSESFHALKSIRQVTGVCLWLSITSTALAADAAEAIRKAAQAEIETADTAAMFKHAELSQKYLVALANLEKTLAASGQLDAIVHVREERETMQKTGDTTAHTDKPLAELRAKYQKSVEAIDAQMNAARAKVVAGIAPKIREQETVLTKAGKVDDALALRKEGERMMLELSGGAAVDAVPFAEDPRATTAPRVNSLEVIKIPDKRPTLVAKPFAIEGRWLEDMSLPVIKQKIREPILIGERPKINPLIVMSPGSVLSASDRGSIDMAFGRFVASKCSFDSVPMYGDLGSMFFFTNCAFDKCRFKKGGTWRGWDQASKYYFENCYFKGGFSDPINIVHNGFRVQTSVFESMDLPPMRFISKQPADYVNHGWLRLIHCRFVKCKIPVSFLLLTRDCVFQNCILTNDPDRPDDEAEITKPFEIVAYGDLSIPLGVKMPEKVKLVKKSATELKGVTIPTAASFAEMMAR